LSKPLKSKASAGAKQEYGREALEKVRRAWGSLILVSGSLLSALGIILVGGWGILPRFLLSLAAAFIVMSILFLVLLKRIASGRGWGWVLMTIGGVVFVFVAKIPSNFIPFKPMSWIDLVQQPLSVNTVLVVLLAVSALCALMGHLMLSSRRR